MMKRLTLAAVLLSTTSAVADAPQVVVDIAPVHSLVATVMEGVGTPVLLLPPGADPHNYAMRPSEARSLSNAEIVIWVGEALTPWLEKPIETTATGADVVELMSVAGFEPRAFEAGDDDHEDHEGHEDHADHAEDDHAEHDHDDDAEHAHEEDKHDEHADHDEHDHDKHADEGHDDHAHDDHADEAHSEDEHAGHDHGAFDPHAWLDPVNGALWMQAITAELSEHDPENAATYQANAKAGVARLTALSDELQAKLAPVQGKGFVTRHDAYGYFVDRFGLEYEGNITSSEAEDPSPADILRVKGMIAEGHVHCVFSELQLSDSFLTPVLEGSAVKSAALDTTGSQIAPGPGAYEALLRGLGNSFAECLSD